MSGRYGVWSPNTRRWLRAATSPLDSAWVVAKDATVFATEGDAETAKRTHAFSWCEIKEITP